MSVRLAFFRTVRLQIPEMTKTYANQELLPFEIQLETEHLIHQLADWPWLLVTQTLSCFLHRTDHGWRTAHEQFHIARRCRKSRLASH